MYKMFKPLNIFLSAFVIVFVTLLVLMTGMQYVVHYNDDLKSQLSPNWQQSMSDIQKNVDNMTPANDAIIAFFSGCIACFLYGSKKKDSAKSGGDTTCNDHDAQKDS